MNGAPEPEVQALLADLEREARAIGTGVEAARLWHEIGRRWEELQSPRNAALAYQNAYRIAPDHVPTLRSARRLFTAVGNWPMVAQLLDVSVQAAASPAEAAPLLVEKGAVLEARLGRREEAIACWERALELLPGHLPALHQLEAAWADGRDLRALASVHERLARAITDGRICAQHLSVAASLRERAGQADEALQLWREAFALDRHDPVVLAQLERLAESGERWDELLEVVSAAAEVSGDAAPALHCRMARIYLDRLQREDLALAALEAARRTSPGDPQVLAELAALHERRGATQELAGVLEARAAAAEDVRDRLGLILKLAALHEERLDAKDRAAAWYRAALEIAPSHLGALSALGRLQHHLGDHEGLLATFRAEAAASEDPRQRASRLFKAGELLAERLGREEDAAAAYEEALAAAPGFLPAEKALIRLLEKRERHAELVALLEREAASASDPEQIVDALSRAAEIQETRLSDGAAAIATYRRILEHRPDHLPTIRALARTAERNRAWEDLVRAGELEATLTHDQRQVVALLHRNCEILEDAIGDRDRAIESYRKVLALAPSYLPALRSLGRLLAQKGRWEELADMYRQEAEVAPTPEAAAALLVKVGELHETRIVDEARAVSAYREALTASPGHPAAVERLARILAAASDHAGMIEVLRQSLETLTSPPARARTLVQIGALEEERLGRPDRAIDAYQEALRVEPGNAVALRALERLYARSGSFRELSQIWERELALAGAEGKVALYEKMAWVHLDRLGDPARASQLCEAALALDPGSVFALATLERIRSAGGDRRERAPVRARLAAVVADPAEAAALLEAAERDRDLPPPLAAPAAETTALSREIEAARDPEVKLAALVRLAQLREKEGDAAGALEAAREALHVAPGHLPTLRLQRRIHTLSGDFGSVRLTLRHEAAATRDPARAVACLLEAGRIAEERLQDAAAAAQDYRTALKMDPASEEAGRRLEEVLALSGGPESLAELYEQRARAEKDPARAAEGLLAAARIFMDRLGSPSKAGALLDDALRLAPGHAEVLERRGDLAYGAAQWEAAARLYGARVSRGGDPRELSRFHQRLGEILADVDTPRAIAHLAAAVEGAPEKVDALELLAQLHLRSRDGSSAQRVLEQLVRVDRDPARLGRAELELGRVREEAHGDLPTAADHYERALDLLPGNALAIERLAAICEKLQDLPRLVKVLRHRAEAMAGSDSATAGQLHARAGEILARQVGDDAGAVVALRAALEHNPSDVSARATLAEVYARAPATQDLAVDEHRALIAVDPLRIDSYRALFRIWESRGDHDRAYVAASLLVLLRVADAAEAAYHGQLSSSRRPEPTGILGEREIELLVHPLERNPGSEVIRAIGDSLGKLYQPDLQRHGVSRSDRQKDSSVLRRLLDRQFEVLGGDPQACDLYVARAEKQQVAIELTDPFAVIVGQDFAARFQRREQVFLLARAAMRVMRRSVMLVNATESEVAAVLGAAVRQLEPGFTALGAPDPEIDRRVGKALARKARKALEQPARLVPRQTPPVDPAAVIAGARYTAERTALLLCGDAGVALSTVLREDGARHDSQVAIAGALRSRRELHELLRFALSDDHFALRARLRMTLG